MKEYIKETSKKKKEYYLYNVPIHIIHPFLDHINFDEVIGEIKKSIPYKFVQGLDVIYIGEFPELDARKISAMFIDGAIYLSSFNDFPEVSEEIIIKDIIHELAHMLEDKFGSEIYSDGRIFNEYNGKKKRLVSMLRASGLSFSGMGSLFFSEDRVDELDDFLLKQLGYDKLSLMTAGLFLSPYSVTSIREYFANGFEEFVRGEADYLKEINPILFDKIKELFTKGEDND
jgi:hypothetical protein